MNLWRATKDDIEHWACMRNALWPNSSAINTIEIERYFAGTSKDIRECFLIGLPEKPVGFIELNIRNYAEGSNNQRVPYVEGWYVDKSHRGKGLGKLLMEKAESWARANGFTEIASDAEIENTRSIAVHKKLGFVETDRIVCFLKKLS